MLNPICHIEIHDIETGKYIEFNFVNNIEIDRSRKTLTTTCKFTLPRKYRCFDSQKGVYADINTIIKRGAKVLIQLGYDPKLRTEFVGYVARLGANTPLEVFCEDEMWQLKQNSFTKAFKNVKLKELIKFVYSGVAIVGDLELGSFIIKDQSTAQVLDALKKFGLQAYFNTDGVLVVDFANSTKKGLKEAVYDFQKNVIDSDLEYTQKDDIRIRCKGISKLPTGKKLEFYYGDKDGDLRTLNYVNLDQKALEKIVKEEINKLKRDGFKNGFTAFGLPYCEPGYAAVLNDPELPERNGSYLVEAVKTSFGVGGFRRNVTLERRLA